MSHMPDDKETTPTEEPSEEVPADEELEEPSTEKEPGEEPEAERPHDPEPDHQAVGIGVVGGPQTDTDSAGGENGRESSDAE